MRHDRSLQSISGRGGWVVASMAMSLLLLTVRAVAQTDWESPRHSTRIAGVDFWSTSDPEDHDDPELKALMPNGGFVMTELYPYFAEGVGWHMWTVWRPRAQWAHSNGFTVITRLMYNQGSCVPGDGEGAAGIELFANWCGEMAQRDRMGEYCHIYIIGNEINHSAENHAAIDGISPQQYSWVYHACRKKIHEVYDGQGRKAVVLAASISPWHPGNPENGDLWFVQFFYDYLWYLNPAENTLLYDIYGDPMVDGFDIHAYGYHNPNQPNPTMDGTTDPNTCGFQIFNWFSEVIQGKPDFARKPVYLTEINTSHGGNDTPKVNYHNNNGTGGLFSNWIGNAYAAVDGYNTGESGRPIKCVNWFVWRLGGWEDYALSGSGGLLPTAKADFLAMYPQAFSNVAPSTWAQGCVRSDGGTAIANAVVYSEDGVYRSNKTGADGWYRIELPGGNTNINLVAECMSGGYLRMWVRNVPFWDGRQYPCDFTLYPTRGSVSGYVLNKNGQPAVNATVSANSGGYSTVTDTYGRYALDAVNSGTYTITAASGGTSLRSAMLNVGATSNRDLYLLQPVDNCLTVNGDFESGNTVGWLGFGTVPEARPNGTWHYGMPARSAGYFAGRGRHYSPESDSGGLYHTLSVSAGYQYAASVWVYTRRDDGGSTIMGQTGDSQGQIGVDPTGGTNPNSGNVIWSDWHESQAQWQKIQTPTFTASGNSATVFLRYRIRKQGTVLAPWQLVAFDRAEMVSPRSLVTISNVYVDGFNGSTAVVHWTTNTATVGTVYTRTSEGQEHSQHDATSTTQHAISVPMSSATTYYLWVKAWNSTSDAVVSEVQTYTTPNSLPPVTIVGPISVVASPYVATVSWTTDVPSTSRVDYGTTTSYGEACWNYSDEVTNHQLGIPVSPETTYHFKVTSTRAGYQSAVSADHTFTTPPIVTISNIIIDNVTHISARIRWTTNVASTSRVDYGTTTSYGQHVYDPSQVTSHAITLNGLSAGTTYHFQLTSTRSGYYNGVWGDWTFTTAPPPGTIAGNVKESSYGQNLAGVTVAASGGYSTSTNSSGNYTLSNLPPGTYTLTVSKTGYCTQTLTGVTVVSQQTTTKNFTLVRQTGTIAGNVKDTGGNNVSGVGVSTNDGHHGYGDTTDASGNYSITNLPAGYYYNVTASKDGYQSQTLTNVLVAANQTTTANFSLAPRLIAVSNIYVDTITPSSAVVHWTTDVASSSRVDYGTTTGYGQNANDTSQVTAHAIQLTGLSAGTTYHYKVTSTCSGYQNAVSDDQTFTTTLPAITISNIIVDNRTQTSARIRWTTNVASTSRVDYGTTTSYGQNVYDASQVTSHVITLTGLTKGTTYHYRLTSTRSGYQDGVSPDKTFTTPLPAITISNIYVDSITQTSAVVHWTTNVASASAVEYGTEQTDPQYVLDGTQVTSHAVTLTGLSAETTYYYKVRSWRSGYETAFSSYYEFTTSPPPIAISNIYVDNIAQTSAVVHWTTNVASTSMVEYGTTEKYGEDVYDATQVTSHAVTLTGLSAATTYHFRVSSTRSGYPDGVSEDRTFTTAVGAITITNIVATPQAFGAVISWTTNIPSTSLVEYRKAGGARWYKRGNEDLVTGHSITLTGLTSNTTYQYRVTSSAKGYETATSTIRQFTTLYCGPN